MEITWMVNRAVSFRNGATAERDLQKYNNNQFGGDTTADSVLNNSLLFF